MKIIIFILIIFLIGIQINSQKVAIIGAGIGGASLTHYLHNSFENLNITVFEKSNRIGGRTHSIDLNTGKKIELGAHFIIDDNHYIRDLVKEFGLSFNEDNIESLGIFKDKEFKFSSSGNQLVTLAKMVWRYGISFFKFMYNESQELKKFMNIYSHQKKQKNNTFQTLEEFLEIVGQKENFNKTAQDVFIDVLSANQLFSEEILDSAISDFYNQNYDVNGFSGMITAAGLQGNPKVVKEGFNSVSEKIFEKYPNTVKLNSKITEIDYNPTSSQYILKIQKPDGSSYFQKFDLVVIATPMEMTNIKFSKEIEHKFENRPSRPIAKYIVASKSLNHKVFNLENESDIPQAIMTPDRILGKISIFVQECQDCYQDDKTGSTEKLNLYRWAGIDKLDESELKQLFPQGYKVVLQHKHDWPYPSLKDSRHKTLPKIILKDGLYYQNSMEFLASCTELQAIQAQNIVNLVKIREGKNWNQKNKRQNVSFSKNQKNNSDL